MRPKLQKSEGTRPSAGPQAGKAQKHPQPDGDTFKAIALEWYGKASPPMERQPCRTHAQAVGARSVSRGSGSGPLRRFIRMELLGRAAQGRGAWARLETADRALMLARQVWEYWLPTADVQQRNITEGLKARLTPYRGKSFAAIVEPQRFGDLMRAIITLQGWARWCARRCSWHRCCTKGPGNLRMMEWAELDLDAALWTIPSMKMKRTKEEKEQRRSPHRAACPPRPWRCCAASSP
jgi:hypothetical protein